MRANVDSAGERLTTTGDIEDEIARVMEAYLADLEGGRAADPERLVAAHPSIAEPLRACLATLDFVRRAASSLSSRTAAAAAQAATPATAPTEPAPATQLGDFRLIREIGRGGMGVVYEAEQGSLGRRVALKVLPFAAVLDPRQLQRFRNEAQAAAHLHHTNIVPVFAVGCERGVHYYAMQYIEGRTLAEVIGELRVLSGREAAGERAPSEALSEATRSLHLSPSDSTRSRAFFRAAANLGVQAAEALEHAHALGVVHRDIKPSNLLLDARGNLWITDFGLAKFEGGPGLTLSGDLLGTLRYMSPEQALAKRVLIDHRSDIYSLGVTLYELLTLEPAFSGRDREEILRQIAFGEPRSPRRVNKAIPTELETIIMKAMAREPERRYATARELADDLRRYLEEKPILARRPTLAERGAKWARRHRTLVGAALVVLILAVIGLAASTLLVSGANRRTGVALNQAERNFEKARAVVDRMFTWFSEDPLAKTPRLEGVRKVLLEEALRFYQGFLEEKSDDPAVRRETALAYRRVGAIRMLLGDAAQAEKAYQEALGLQEKLIDALPGAADRREDLAETWYRLGVLWMDTQRAKEAEDAFLKGIGFWERLVKESPKEARYRRALASNYTSLGILLFRLHRERDAEMACLEGVRLGKELVTEFPRVGRYKSDLANYCANLAEDYLRSGRRDDAERLYKESLALCEDVKAEFEDAPEFRRRITIASQSVANMLRLKGKVEEAEKLFRQAVEASEKLAIDFPAVPEYHGSLGAVLNDFALLFFDKGDLAPARDLLEKAIVHQQAALNGNPQDPEARRFLRNHFALLGRILVTSGKHEETAKLGQSLLDEFPGDAGAASAGADALAGSVLLAEKDSSLPEGERQKKVADYRERARQAFLSAIDLYKELNEKSPGNAEHLNQLATTSHNLGTLLYGAGNIEEVLQRFEEALGYLEDAVKLQPEVKAYQDRRREALADVVQALLQLGRHAGAARRAAALAQLLPETTEASYTASCFLARCVPLAEKDTSLPEAERQAQARSYSDRAMALLAESVQRGFNDANGLKASPDFEPLRSREDFQKILTQLEEGGQAR